MADCHAHCHSEAADAPLTINRKLKIMLAIFAGTILLSFAPPLAALNEALLDYLSLIWWAVLLGLVLGGIIDYFVPDGFMIRFLGGKRKTTLFNAVIAGFLMSACSHGILAIAIQLYKKGASVPAVITFLLASPWANLPMTVLLFGFFGWQAIFFVLGAMVIALITGFIFTLLDRAGLIEGANPLADPGAVEWARLKQFNAGDAASGVFRGAVSLANMVLWWILLGVLLAALIGAFVPEHLFMDYMGPDFAGMLVTLLFATIIEVCSEGTSPLAFEIFNKTGVLGNPFVFLMAGVATDYTEIGLLWTNIGKRTAIWLPVITVPQILAVGLALNYYVMP
jgi:uncharacterized membrane protein YraQ (UPF0718 family)